MRGAKIDRALQVVAGEQAVDEPRGEGIAAADSVEIPNVARVTVTEAADIRLTLLFDPEHDLEERILKEQFAP